MPRLLRRIGLFAHRRRYSVLGAWVLLLVVLAGALSMWGNALADEFTVPGSQSQVALDTVRTEFPAAGSSAVEVVLHAPSGRSLADGADAQAVTAGLKKIASVPEVVAVVTPQQAGTITPDGSVAMAQVHLSVAASDVQDTTLDQIQDAMVPAANQGVRVEYTGSAYSTVPSEGGHAAEAAGILLALVIIAVTVGSVIAAGLPILTSLVGVAVGLIGLWLASDLTTISTTAPSLATMLGLAVGIDYALLLLVRHRSELARGASLRDAIGITTSTAGTSVVFAGSTVIIALLGLAVARLPFLTVMGIAAAGMVLVAVLVATTLVPALLAIAGERLRPKPGSRAVRTVANDDTMADSARPRGERWVSMVSRRPVPVLIVGILALGALAIPVASLQLALPDNGSQPTDTTVRQAYDTVSDTFGPGVNGPLLVLADLSGSQDPQAAATTVAHRIGQTDGVATAASPVLSQDHDWALIQVVPTTGPTAQQTTDLVNRIRSESDDLASTTGATIAVTGTTAQSIDVSDLLAGAIIPFALVVVGLSFLLLMLVFGSILVPLTAALGYLLSLGAALGITVGVFQWGWLGDGFTEHATGPLVSFSPVIVMAVLFGLAMDYQLFLVSRIHEAVQHGIEPRRAIAVGGRHAARVVVAAALIMTGVFGSFVVSGTSTLRTIALALAVGVLIDAFVVRLTLVPAALGLLGDRAWWLPGWLAKRLPRLDVEGTGVTVDSESAAIEPTNDLPVGRRP